MDNNQEIPRTINPMNYYTEQQLINYYKIGKHLQENDARYKNRILNLIKDYVVDQQYGPNLKENASGSDFKKNLMRSINEYEKTGIMKDKVHDLQRYGLIMRLMKLNEQLKEGKHCVPEKVKINVDMSQKCAQLEISNAQLHAKNISLESELKRVKQIKGIETGGGSKVFKKKTPKKDVGIDFAPWFNIDFKEIINENPFEAVEYVDQALQTLNETIIHHENKFKDEAQMDEMACLYGNCVDNWKEEVEELYSEDGADEQEEDRILKLFDRYYHPIKTSFLEESEGQYNPPNESD